MPGIEIHTDQLPLVRIAYHDGAADADFERLFAGLDRVLGRRQKFVNMVEASGVTLPTATQRKHISEWCAENWSTLESLSTGVAIVVNNPLQSGIVTAITWIMRPRVSIVAFRSRPEAMLWCRDRLVEHSVAVHSHLDELFARAASDAGRAG